MRGQGQGQGQGRTRQPLGLRWETQRHNAFRRPDGGRELTGRPKAPIHRPYRTMRPEIIQHPAKAVAAMQASALHLRDRSPKGLVQL